jgi:hypothetical protein
MKIRHAALVLGVLLGGTLVATPAWAVPGLRFVSWTGPSGSPASAAGTAECPDGWAAVGGGAVIGGSTRVRINAAVPGPDGFTALAVEPAGGVGEQWQLVVSAVCAPVTSLPGLLYVSAFSSWDSAASHSTTVECPGGRRLVGMGGLVDSDNVGQDRLTLAGIRPDTGLTALTATGAETAQGFTGPWRAKATAVCATGLPGLARAVAYSSVDSAPAKQVRAACPAGTVALSTGFDAYPADGGKAVSAAFPDQDLGGVPNRQGVEVTAREIGTAYAASWRLAGYGICAN